MRPIILRYSLIETTDLRGLKVETTKNNIWVRQCRRLHVCLKDRKDRNTIHLQVRRL